MGVLKLFGRRALAPDDGPPPRGSYTVDAHGKVMASTLPRGFPEASVQEITRVVLATFQAAREGKLGLAEFTVSYGAFKITARELRGGAVIFLAPQSRS
jgi:hypothetical protein